MNVDSPASTSSAPPPPKKRRGVFSFLFKSALGCTAFAIGALIVFVLMLPTIVSKTFAKSAAENAFGEMHQGSLALDGVGLAWFRAQTVDNVVISDPEGRPVLRASAKLPSLAHLINWKSGGLKEIHVELEGDLVADDQGVTNLQRALAKRAPAETTPEPIPPDDGSSDVSEMLAHLDTDVTVHVKRLTWSDAETRKLGAPFEVRDFAAKLTAKPGAPIRVEGAGQLVSDPPGRIAIDATVHGPIQLDRAWPVGTVDADVKIEKFSTAMVDGIAGLGGDLKELLGPTFDVTLRATGATPTAGDLDLTLDSQRTSVKVKGRFADNAFVSVGEPAVVASIATPQAVLARRLAPHLPAGMKIVPVGGENQACTLRVENLVLPIPSGPPADRRQASAALERLRCDVALDLPATRVESDKVPPLAIDGTLTASVAPGAPLVVALDADLSGTAKLALRASVPEPGVLVSEGKLLPSELDARIDALPVAWIEAFAPSDLRIGEALGESIDVALTAKNASLDTGQVKLDVRSPHATVELAGRLEHGVFLTSADEGLRVRATLPPRWTAGQIAAHLPPGHRIELAEGPIELRATELAIPFAVPSTTPTDPFAPYADRASASITCTLPTIRWSDESSRARAELAAATIHAHLAATNALDLTVRSSLDTGTRGELNVDVRVPDAWALARMQSVQHMPPIDVAVRVDRLPTALVDALAGTNGLLATWLGPQITAGVEIDEANLSAGHVEVRVETAKVTAALAGKLEGGVFQASGDEGLKVAARVTREDFERALAARMSPGTQFDGALFEQPIELVVRNVSLAIPDFAAAKGSSATAASPTAGQMLEGLSAETTVSIPAFSWSNESMRAAKQTLGVSKCALRASVAPKAPLEAELDADIAATSPGKLTASVRVEDPWSVLRGAGAPLPPIDARLVVDDLPADMIELVAGAQPMLVSLVGSPIDVEVSAEDAALDRGAIRAKVTTPSTSLAVAGRIEESAFVCSGDEGLDLTVQVPAQFLESQITPKLPAGTRLALSQDAGALTAKIRNTRFSFASTAEGAVRVRDAAAARDELASVALKDSSHQRDGESSPGQGGGSDSPQDGQPGESDASAAPGPNAALAFLANLGLKLEAGLPDLQYSDAATDAAGRPIVLRDTRVFVELAPGAPPSAGMSSKIDDAEPGSIDVSVRALDPLSKLAQPGELERVRIAADVKATQVPTALVDLMAKQDGLLVDALGQKLELKAKTDALSMEQGKFVVDLTSPQASLHASGEMKDKTISMSRTDRGVARFQLTPLASERVVGNLVPMMFSVSKPAGSDPVVLTLDDLSFPLDGDLSNLDATVNLNLGEVNYRLLPGLESLLGSLAGTKTVKIPQLMIPIRQGVATYQDLPIAVGNTTCKFSGTFSLVDKSFRMATAIPLSALGKKVNSALEGARQFLDPNMPVPIEISGTWKSPRVAIGEDFMKSVVENAAKGGLEDLLKGLGGKKKKD